MVHGLRYIEKLLSEVFLCSIVCYVVFITPAPEITVYLAGLSTSMDTVGMEIRPERGNEAIFLTEFSLPAGMAENMMPLHAVHPRVHAAIHIISKDAPEPFHSSTFHFCFISSIWSGVIVSIPRSFASWTVPSIRMDISRVS